MIKHWYFRISIFAIIILANCGSKEEFSEVEVVLNELIDATSLQHLDYVIVIPRAGCGGCIDSAVKFVTTNIDQLENTHIIFTGQVDRKLLKLQLGSEFLDRKNVLIDEQELFQSLKLNTSYPHVIKLENGKTANISEMNTEIKFMETLF